MKVHLQYHPEAGRQVGAALIPGKGLADWLPELERWGLLVTQLQAYVLPTSMADRSPAGLLVLLPAGKSDLPWGECIPCQLLANGLALPVDASFYPPMTDEELARSLLFPVQLLHPTLGMVGWELQERLDWSKHIASEAASSPGWIMPHPGNAPSPELNEIKLPESTMGQTMQALKDAINPHERSPEGDNQGQSAWGRFVSGLFKGGLSMTQGMMGALPEGSGGGSENHPLSKLSDWLSGKIDSLQGQRDSAIDKLLDMFDRNLDEALRYAIPMSSPYADRGMGSATGGLSARNTNFNLGGIGGGLGGNAWNVSAQRQQALRERYLKAANEAVAKGDFDKAAYIYAHLLHDLNSAANVLQQGKMYREAAAIYKEHLKNLPMAAECLEKGGLLLDAIDIYLQLERWEKAGDLYATVGKRARAEVQYERCVKAAHDKGDYIEAARLLVDKIERDDRARDLLLEGWKISTQRESCLSKYLDLVVPDSSLDLPLALDELYQAHTPQEQQGMLVAGLSERFDKLPTDAAKQAARRIGYEIISSRTEAGHPSLLSHLSRFLPQDSMIGNDVSRFLSKAPKAKQEPVKPPQLNKNILWRASVSISNQVFALGVEGHHLWLARFNFQGSVEYYHWAEPLSSVGAVRLLPSRSDAGPLLLYSVGNNLGSKSLPQNERFSAAVEILSSRWLVEGWAEPAALGINAQSWIIALNYGVDCTTLRRFHPDGTMELSRYLKLADGSHFALPESATWQPLIPFGEGYIVGLEQVILHIDRDLVVHGLALPGRFCDIAFHGKAMYVATEAELLKLQVDPGTGEWLPVEKLFLGMRSYQKIEVLPGNLLVGITTRAAVEAFAIDRDGLQLLLKAELDMEPVAIIPGPYRRTFCLLGTNGTIQNFEIPDVLDDWVM